MANIKKFANTKNIILLSLLLVFFLLLRWNTFTTPFERDEGEYAYSAWLLRDGQMPYENSFMQKPPMIVYVYLLGQVVSPDALWPPRIIAAIFVALSTLFFALIAEKEFGKNAGWITAFLVTPMLVMPQITAFSANTEVFMLLPLSALLFLFIYKKESVNLSTFLFAGVLAAFSILFKPISIYVVVFIVSVWFIEMYKKNVAPNALFKRSMFVAIGGILATLLALLPFLLNDGAKYFWENVIEFNRFYATSWGYGLGYLFRYINIFWKSYWALMLLVLYFLFKRPTKWWLYIGLLLTALIAVYQTPIGHYYVLVIPFLALISAYSIILLSKVKTVSEVLKRNTILWITVCVLITMVYPIRKQFGMTPEQLGVWVYGHTNPFQEASIIADKAKERTLADDYIFVAGSEPEIYYYAKRKSPTRFVITYPLIINTPKIVEYQKEAIKDLEEKPPKAIIYSKKQHSGLWEEGAPRIFIDYLIDLLENDYEISGGYIWRGEKGYWLEDIEEKDITNASLLLYSKVEN